MRILYIEPFHGGSHRRFGRVLLAGIDADWTAITLPGRHWKWRMRGTAPHLALDRREVLEQPYDVLLASSYVALAELRGLVPSLADTPAALYFHENQFAYPTQGEAAERDHHYGFTQLVSALAARRCVFNSRFNRDTFLEEGARVLARMPDAVPAGWIDAIAERSLVLPIPLDLEPLPRCAYEPSPREERERGPVILWNHRWEHDKGPDRFFAALDALAERDVPFRVAVCGETFSRKPPVFDEARERLGERIVHWGHVESRRDYEALLGKAHLAVSTARHEFFGIASLEATWFGACPVVPDALAYRETFPDEHRYADDADLVARLSHLCTEWTDFALDLHDDRTDIVRPFLASSVLPAYGDLLRRLACGRSRPG